MSERPASPPWEEPEPLAPNLSLSSVYRIKDLDHLDAIYSGAASGHIYARDGHPNADRLAALLAKLEGAEAAAVACSGMASIASILLDQLSSGDRILADRSLYGKTVALLDRRIRKLGIQVRFTDLTDVADVEAGLAEKPKQFWVESMSNPLLRVAPIDRLAELAHAAGALLVVDSTFTPPPMLRPLELGADLVVHSLTKILSGHSDVTLGVALGPAGVVQALRETASIFGYTASPFECWLTERGLATHELRLERACENARRLADFLRSQAKVNHVFYPGIEGSADHAWLSRHAQGFGFMLSFEMDGGRDGVNRWFQALRTVPFCPSLGDVRTTLSYPAATSHRSLDAQARRRLGITDGVVRVSVGIDRFEALADDFAQAFASLDGSERPYASIG